jgi:hypothetical protein
LKCVLPIPFLLSGILLGIIKTMTVIPGVLSPNAVSLLNSSFVSTTVIEGGAIVMGVVVFSVMVLFVAGGHN